MSGDDSTSGYAPKSPDLSSFYSGAGPTQPASPLYPPTQQGGSGSPGSSGSSGSSGQHNNKLHPPGRPYAYGGRSYAPPMQAPEFLTCSPPAQQYYSPPNPSPNQLPPQNNPHDLQPARFQQTPPSQHYSSHIRLQAPPQIPPAYPTESPATSAQYNPDMPPRRAAAAPPAPVIDPSPVKTKFPTARIKRIMQADEEVGKVAQQTPIAVGKALELFMIQLVSKSADVAKEKGSKRVTASMLKQVVETDDQWDFLRDIVSRVENDKEGAKSKPKAESDSDDDSEPKKRGRSGGRKKKV
ncbi:hypothetical protein C2857_004394 [Epichloe festucae Fl1]|uniref:NCT transcriptional regulatory complex subunit A n=1 Tax=Epichloe festucae (strain Fl1) TaxID=877507 RepID=A0A7U3SN77_EPIFF|nr:hypothetical protein C2857_004394 [Epichloe festucae Fl1]